jgi:site-specific recombinase XerD
MITVKTICAITEKRMQELSYNASTISEYKKGFCQLIEFARDSGKAYYSKELGQSFIKAPSSKQGTSKNGFYRLKKRKHIITLFDQYVATGKFEFEVIHRKPKFMPETPSYAKLLNSFVEHLQSNGLALNTIESYRLPAYHLLHHFELKGITIIDDIHADKLPEFIEKSNAYWKNSDSLRNALCGLRSFTLFLNRRELSAVFQTMHPSRSKHIIPILTVSDQEKLWALLNSNQLLYRDKAIILLSLTTGIRASDILALQLCNIDWKSDSYSFTQMKTGNPVTHPLLAAVGNALSDYILHERPMTSHKRIFIRSLAPYKPLSDHSAVYSIIRNAFSKANIPFDQRICGTTLLRHNAASMMLRNGVSQEIIAAVLGHADPDTTSIYITTDEDRLRDCVLPLINSCKEANP